MKTDNSHFEAKIKLRIDHLPQKKDIIVLDCYAGTGRIWNWIKKECPGKNIKVLAIEKEQGKNKLALVGDNLKYLSTIDLSKFDIIDLDAYGIPFDQIEILYTRGYHGIVFVTAIQSMMGALPKKMLLRLGYTEKMIEKIPSIFNKNGIGKLKNILYLYGCQYISGYFIDRKNYFMFNL